MFNCIFSDKSYYDKFTDIFNLINNEKHVTRKQEYLVHYYYDTLCRNFDKVDVYYRMIINSGKSIFERIERNYIEEISDINAKPAMIMHNNHVLYLQGIMIVRREIYEIPGKLKFAIEENFYFGEYDYEVSIESYGNAQETQMYYTFFNNEMLVSPKYERFYKKIHALTYDSIMKKDKGTDREYDLIKIIEFIDKNYNNKCISLKCLSQHFLTNHTTLTSQFKCIIGVSIKEYIQICRIIYAMHLISLTKDKLKLKVIAEAVGFYDYPHFNKTFKKYTGITPKLAIS